jgi:hypothetical protein
MQESAFPEGRMPPPAASHPAAGDSREACDCGHGCAEAPISGTQAQRYQVVLHVEQATLSGKEEGGLAWFEDGVPVSAETARRLTCDTSTVTVTRGPDGSVLDVGRRTRTIPPALRRALEARDGGCRFPGCGSRFTVSHHVKHWSKGGETSLSNCVLVCRYHHWLVHEGGWRVEWWGVGNAAFIDPKGNAHVGAPRRIPQLPEDPVAALVEENRRLGIEPDGWTGSARWEREQDVPLDVYLRAIEALLP